MMEYIERLKPEEKRNFLIILFGASTIAIIDIWIFGGNPPIEWILIELAIIGFLLYLLYRTITSAQKKKGKKKTKSKKRTKADEKYRRDSILLAIVRISLLVLAAALIYFAFVLPDALLLLYLGIVCIAIVAILSIYANRRHERKYGRSYPD